MAAASPAPAASSASSASSDVAVVRSGLDGDSGILNRPCFRVEVTADTSRATDCEVIAIVGQKNELASAFERLGSMTEGTASLLNAMVADVPQPDTGFVVRETYMGSRVFVVLLPSRCSRHNSPAQPDAVRSAVASLPCTGPCMIILANSTRATVRARTIAAAKAFPMYSRKTGEVAKSMRRSVISLVPHCGEGDVDDAELKAMQVQAASSRIAGALVDAPTSELHTDAFVDIALKVASECGATSVSVTRGTDLKAGGFGGLWGVGKAASHPPALVVLDYNPTGSADAPSVCLVGKGIVYDTGGLSIKGKTGMPGMKRDMGGAAAVLGAFRSIAMAGGAKRVVALLCLAENSVASNATRPDDILHMYSGKTVEVNNTDAEGRLVLADGVAYAAKHLSPVVIIDIATLTGAQGIATGRHFGALYCNDDELETLAVQTGKAVGEMVHPLPFAPEFFQKEFASAVADMKNSVKDRANAQSSCAGQFIGAHMPGFVETGRWLHIDIAYPSFSGERGTGFGAALLANIVAEIPDLE